MNIAQVAIISIYLFVLILCAALIVGADFLGPSVRNSLLPVASEGFKVVIGALIGTLSALVSMKKS